MNDPATIAAGLSAAMRKALLSITYSGWFRPDEGSNAAAFGWLARKGLLDRCKLADFGVTYMLNDAGLAVRKILER